MSKERPDRVELHGYSVKIHLRERKLNSRNLYYPFKRLSDLLRTIFSGIIPDTRGISQDVENLQ